MSDTGGEYVVGDVITGRRVCVKGKDRGGLLVLEDNRVQSMTWAHNLLDFCPKQMNA